MLFKNDDDVRKECEKLGYAGVEARLNINDGYFGGWRQVASEWATQHREAAEENRHLQIFRSAQLTAYASWGLVFITFLSVIWQMKDSGEQRRQMQEQIEQQRKDSEAQRDDAKALLEVQISVELDKQFDSPEMRNARRRLANQLLKNKELTEFRMLDFFEKLAMYTDQERIDQDTVYQSYSYWIERYWPALKSSIKEIRQMENDPSYYVGFEELDGEMLARDAKDGLAAPSKKEIQRFLKEEAMLPQ